MKVLLNLSIDPEIVALIKQRIKNISNYVEKLFIEELELSQNNETDKLAESKIRNAKLAVELDEAKQKIDKMSRLIEEKRDTTPVPDYKKERMVQ